MDATEIKNRNTLLQFVELRGYSTSNGRIPLDFYKKEVNLVNFAVHALNYQIDSKKTSRFADNQRWFYLKRDGMKDRINEDPEHANNSMVIGRKSEHPDSNNFKYNGHYYFSQQIAQSGERSGSIIDLVRMHYKADFPGALRIIENTIVQNNALKENFDRIEIVQTNVNEKSETRRLNEYHGISPLYDNTFLAKRGISDEILNDARFVSQIKNSTEEGNKHINTAFPISGKHGIIGFEVRNDNFKGVKDQKQDGFWRSVIDRNRPVDAIILNESAIDALSHAQLKDTPTNDLYLSSAGNITGRQIDLLQEMIDKGVLAKPFITSEVPPELKDKILFTKEIRDSKNAIQKDKQGNPFTQSYVAINQPKTLVLAFDNDNPGRMLSIKTLGKLSASTFFSNHIEEGFKDSEVTVYRNHNNGRVNWQMKSDDEQANNQAVEKIISYFNKANKKGIGKIDDEIPFQIERNKNNVQLRFKNLEQQWDVVLDSVKELKFANSNKLKIERALTKDFNQDLKGKLGLDLVAKKQYERAVQNMQANGNINSKTESNEATTNLVQVSRKSISV